MKDEESWGPERRRGVGCGRLAAADVQSCRLELTLENLDVQPDGPKELDDVKTQACEGFISEHYRGLR